jgi:hypothetical protein
LVSGGTAARNAYGRGEAAPIDKHGFDDFRHLFKVSRDVALGQKAKFRVYQRMSAFASNADTPSLMARTVSW